MGGLLHAADSRFIVEEVASGSSEYDDDGGVGDDQRRTHRQPQTSLGKPCLPATRIARGWN